MSEQLARHEEADNVDRRHVGEAFEALARLGLRRRSWWRRPELEVGFGSFLLGLGLASPDVLPVFFPTQYVGPTLLVLVMCGAFCAVHGWFRGRL